MVRLSPYLDEIEKAMGRGNHVHRINEGTWTDDMMLVLNRTSIAVAKDLAVELNQPTWDFAQAGENVQGEPFHMDSHPRFLGLALILLCWLWWQEPTHTNITKEHMMRLIQQAWKEGEERAAAPWV